MTGTKTSVAILLQGITRAILRCFEDDGQTLSVPCVDVAPAT